VPDSRLDRVPPPVLVLVAIASVQIGSAGRPHAVRRPGAGGSTLLRLGLSALLLLAVLRPAVRAWTRDQWLAALLLGGRWAR
jgi:inner membrane transporter RhtA